MAAVDKKLRVADLSPDQLEVYEGMMDWSANPTKGMLTVGGFAGVGKSALLGVFAASTDLHVAYVAFTGRAASVLERKLRACGVKTDGRPYKAPSLRDDDSTTRFFSSDPSATYCGTIHRLLYRPTINAAGELLGWNKRDTLDRDYDLIVVDEASMVSDEMLIDLRAHGTPIMAVGDHGQLPPVKATGSVVQNPDLRLETIHRQAAGSPVIALSKHIREGGRLRDFVHVKAGGSPLVTFRSRRDIDLVLRESGCAGLDTAIICWTNRDRVMLNGKARTAEGFSGVPKKSETVLCLKNEPPVFNGMRGILTEDAIVSDNPRSPWHLFASVEFPDDEIRSARYTLCASQFHREKTLSSIEELESLGIDVATMPMAGSLYDFGYAMTVHKCVAPETLVETPSGLIRAENLGRSGSIATPIGRAKYKNFVRNPPRQMLEIVTADGYKLRVTPDHGIDVWDPTSGYVRKEARELLKNDFLCLRLGGEFDSSDASLPPASTPDVRAKRYILPKTCNLLFAEFLGLMVADGTVYKAGFRLAKRHKDVADRFDYLCRILFGASPSRFYTLNAHHVEVSSTFLREWLARVGVTAPNAKRVPDCILQSSMAAQARFLRGLFEDGGVNINRSGVLDHIEFTSCEDQVRETVRTMLLRFGIVCGATNYRKEGVYIYGQYAKLFGEKIGFVAKTKNDKLQSAPALEGTRYVFPLRSDELHLSNKPVIQRHRIQELPLKVRKQFADRVGFHHSRVERVLKYRGPSVCVTVPDGNQFLQNGFCGWNCQGSSADHVIWYVDMPERVNDEGWRRWAYTAVTRASRKLTILT